MPMPTVYNVGAVGSGTGAVVLGLPAGTVAGDILVLFIESEDVTAVPAMTGWTDVTSVFVASGTVTRLTVRWKRAGPSEGGPTVPDPGDHLVARIVGLRGCVPTGTPWIAVGSNTELVSDTSVSIPGATTAFGDCLILAAFSTGTDVASTAHVTGFANASLAAVTERVDNWVIDGLGGGLGVASGEYAIRGTYSATTATCTTANFKALISVAFQGDGDFAGPHTGPTPGRLGPTGQWRPFSGGLPQTKTPPVFIAEYESAWNTTTTPKTISVTVQTGDVLVISGVTADAVKTLATPTGGSHSYTLQQSSAVASNTAVFVWTAVAVANETFTLSVASVGGTVQFWGFNALQYRGSDGVGASGKAQAAGAPGLGMSTLGANSAVVAVNGDWSAQDGAARTYRTVNAITPVAGGAGEQTYFRDAAQYATYVAYWSDTGYPTFNTYGIATPGGQTYTIAAVEVYGTTTVAGGGADATISAATVAAVAAVGSVTVQAGSAVTPATVAAIASVDAPTVRLSATISPATVAAIAPVGTVTVQAGAAVTAATVVATASVGTVTVRLGVLVGAATVVAVASVGAPTLPDQPAAPATVAAVASVGTITVQAGAAPAPATVVATATVGSPTLRWSAAISPATVPAVATVGAPTVRAGAAPAPATVVATASVGAPGVQAGAAPAPATVVATATVATITRFFGTTVSPATVAAIASVGVPQLGGAANVTPATVSAVATVGAVTVQAGSAVAPATVPALATVGAPTVQAGAAPIPATVSAVAAVGAVTVRISAAITPNTVAAIASVGTAVLVTAPTPATVAALSGVGTVNIIAFVATPGSFATSTTVPAFTSSSTGPRFTGTSRTGSASSNSAPHGRLTSTSSGGDA